ncbi:HAMP domain-containing protein [Azospirillum humicireducens]|uniref:HAMP domain-containing protein n=1 Tax=Azospirillum humicireducens TaxID=1226968 RepID=A0A160JF80_9PROT|nr:HAMP domain-containing protein [Azospirillum humicireducens]ANC91194.1 HAMP domain-containing protein [Azospirillum humicireducens]
MTTLNTFRGPLRGHGMVMAGIPAVILLAAALAMAGVGLLGTWLAQDQLGEARAAKAAAVAEAVQHDLERAIAYGIPLPRIEGVAAFLQGIAGRNPDLGFLALTGGDGVLLQGAVNAGGGIDAAGLQALTAGLRGLPTPETRAATLQPIERDGLLILRVPVRVGRLSSEGGGGGVGQPPAGHVLVGVQPQQVRGQIAGELATVVFGGLAVLLLLAELAGVLARASFRAPLRRLALAMTDAVDGRFATLLGRRPRDQVGRLLFAFNAVVFGLHDRRQRFAAHADEVRAAVFDPEVAAAVESTRLSALTALGPGLEAAPRREIDSRSDDVHAFALLSAAAAPMLVLGAGPAAAGPVLVLVLAVALAGAAAGYAVPFGWRRAAAVLNALALLSTATMLLLDGTPLAAGLAGGVTGGFAAGLALSYVRRQAADGGQLSLLRALASGIAAALLWAVAVGWDSGMLTVSSLLPAALAALLSRPIVVLRS